MRRVPVVVRRFDDEQARAYAIEDNLFNSPASSRLTLVHIIVLARALNECGGECTPRQIWEAAGVSPSTYWRADGSLNRSLRQILMTHPELQELSLSSQVAEIMRKDLAPHLTRLFMGEMEINTYHLTQERRERPDRQVERRAIKSSKSGVRRRASEAVSVISDRPPGKTLTTAMEITPKKPEKKDSNLSLLDLLSS